MTGTFDELIERLLYDVSLSGSKGIGSEQFESAVKAFYAQQKSTEQTKNSADDDDLLFSTAPPACEVDDAFIDYVFDWLCKHPDVRIKDVPARDGDVIAPVSEDSHNQTAGHAVSSTLKDKLSGKCICTTDDRMWRAIAGHGIDVQRVPLKEFECLSIIAASGPAGLLQPELVRLSGQDKRSVPHRTDCLAQKGYITKESVIGSKSKTSLLKLRKYAGNDSLTDPASLLPAGTNSAIRKPVIYYDKWFNETMRMLKDNQNIISMEDLRIGLGIHRKRWERKALIRCIRRLDDGGCIRRLTAQVQDREGNALRKVATAQAKQVKAIQLIREPTDYDRLLWTQSAPKTKPSDPNAAQSTHPTVNGDDVADSDDDGEAADPEESNDLDLIQQRIPPQWTPNTPYANLLFDMVDQSGSSGISSMNLSALATGPQWRRPLDEVMGKLTDVWRFSQPPNLRHLTIIRDTAVHGKSAHYQYRSLANFEKAVEAGDADWKAIGGDPNDPSTAAKRRWAQPDLDKWGFSKVNPKDFVGQSGTASLLDAMRFVRKSAYIPGPTRAYPCEDEVFNDAKKPSYPQTSKPLTCKRKREGKGMSVVEVKRRKLEEKEVLEFDTIAQRVAENRVLAQLNNSSPSINGQAPAKLARKDLPLNLVQQAKEEVLKRENAGIYINPPGSRCLKQDNFYQRGRPRNALIAVVKTNRLHQLPWFGEYEEMTQGDRLQPRPVLKRKVSTVLDPQSTDDHSQDLDSATADDPAKRRRTVPEGGDERLASELDDEKSTQAQEQEQILVMEPPIAQNNSVAPLIDVQDDNPLNDKISLATTDHVRTPQPESLQEVTLTQHARAVDLNQSRTVVTSRLADLKSRLSQLRHKRGRRSKEHVNEVRRLESEITLLEANILVDEVQGSNSDTGPHLECETQQNGEVEPDTAESKVDPKSERRQLMVKLKVHGPDLATLIRDADSQEHNEQRDVASYPLEAASSATDISSAVPSNELDKASRTSVDGKASVTEKITNQGTDLQDEVAVPATSSTPEQAVEYPTPVNLAHVEQAASNSNVMQTSRYDTAENKPAPSNGAPEIGVPLTSEEIENEDPSPQDRILDGAESGDHVLELNSSDDLNPDGPMEFSLASEVEVLPLAKSSTDDDPSNKKNRKSGTRRCGGFVAAQREQCILDAIRQCNGVFPGNNEIWYAVTTFWRKRFKQTPDKHTVDRVITNLIARRKLKKFRFQFRSKKGTMQTRAILAAPGIGPQSQQVLSMQKNIKDAWPDQYLPPQVDIDIEMRKHAANMYNRKVVSEPNEAKGASKSKEERKPQNKKYPLDAEATVRQTDHGAEHLDAEAQLLGFANAEAFHKFQVERNPAYRLKWERLGYLPSQENSASAAPRRRKRAKIAPKRKSDDSRKPLSSIHSIIVGHGAVRKPQTQPRTGDRFLPSQLADSVLDPQWGLSSKDNDLPNGLRDTGTNLVESQRYSQAIARMMAPIQVFFPVNGTFGTQFSQSPGKAVFAEQHDSDSIGTEDSMTTAELRRRLKHVAEHEASKPSSLEELLNRVALFGYIVHRPGASKQQEFFTEIDAVHKWEEINQKLEDYKEGDGRQNKIYSFINHAMNQPHITPTPESSPAPSAFAYGQTIYPQLTLAQPIIRNHIWAPSGGYVDPASTQPAVPSNRTPATPPTSSQSVPVPPAAQATLRKRPYKPRAKRSKTSNVEGISKPDAGNVPGPSTTQKKVLKRTTVKTRDRASAAAFKDGDRLVVAFALVAAICGGVNQNRFNWNLIAHALGFRYDGDFLRRRWGYLRKYRLQDAEKIRDAIREPFLKAYEDGKLPKIDFQNLENTDWSAMFSWVQKEVLPLEDEKQGPVLHELPESKAILEATYETVARQNPYEPSRDDYFTGNTDTGRRQIASRLAYGTCVSGSQASEDASALINSWARAVAMTKQWHYNPVAAERKMSSIFTNEAVKDCSKDLVKRHIFVQDKKNRQLPGRNFRVHNDVLSQFKRWPNKQDEFKYLRTVAQAWQTITTHLESHDQIDLIPVSTDPYYLVLTNMARQGLLHVSPGLPKRNDDIEAPFPRLSPWGYSGYGYETKKIDARVLKFSILYTKTSTYTSAHGLRTDVPIPLSYPRVKDEPAARIPFWIDIHGNLMEDVWDMAVRSILQLVVFRVGYNAGDMEVAHHGKFGAWEIEIVLDWMEKVGIAERWGEGTEDEEGRWKGGWRAGGFWYCAFLPEVAGWKGPGGV